MANRIVPVTLVTTVFNEAQNIEEFLQSYRQQSVLAQEFVIVDGGSTDDTAAKIAAVARSSPELNIRLIVDNRCSRKYTTGPIAKGRNTAIAQCRTEWVVVTDAGCQLQAGWLEAMYSRIQQGGCDVVSGWYEPMQGNRFQALYAASTLLRLEQVDAETFLPSSRNIAFKKSCWEQVGGYPEQTFTAEDTLFDLLLKRAGYRFAFAPEAVVYWDCPRTLGEAWQKQVRYGEGDGYLRLFPGRTLLGYIKIVLPVGSLIRLHRPRLALLKYVLLLANQLGYTKGIIKRLKHAQD